MSKIVPLKHPFKFGDREVNELTFKRLKCKQLRKLPGNPTFDDLLGLASKSAGEPPALIDEVDAEDGMAIVEVIGDFLGGIRPTGESA